MRQCTVFNKDAVALQASFVMHANKLVVDASGGLARTTTGRTLSVSMREWMRTFLYKCKITRYQS